jgi:predicted XRE-type DNA-binding protein
MNRLQTTRREKPLHWVGSSKKDYFDFPKPVQYDMGYALGLAQLGGKHPKAKPWKGEGQGVFEIVEDYGGAILNPVLKEKAMTEITITEGTTNVFADLGFADASERQTKTQLAYVLNEIIKSRKMKQVEVARLLQVHQSKVSALKNYRLDGFSVEQLLQFLTALNQDVEIMIRPRSENMGTGQISVFEVR